MIVKIQGTPITEMLHMNKGFEEISREFITTPVGGNASVIILIAATAIYLDIQLKKKGYNGIAMLVKIVSFILSGLVFIDAFLDSGTAIAMILSR